MSAPDIEIFEAVRSAARVLRASGPLPPKSEDVLRFAILDQLRQAGIQDAATEKSGITGGWVPLPCGLDLFAGPKPHRWAAETKVWDVGQQIWDGIKLAAGIAHDDLKVGYLIAAACPSAFASRIGRDLFSAIAPQDLSVRELIERHPALWQSDLNGGSARPVEVPATIRVQLLLDEAAWFGHRLRVVRVALGDAEVQRFANGWPDGVIARPSSSHPGTAVDALGLAVPARWSQAWWTAARRDATAEQFEALYGLLMTRRWSDDDIRAHVQAPRGGAPPWWS